MKKFLKIVLLTILLVAIATFFIWHGYLKNRDINEEKTVMPSETYTYEIPEDSEPVVMDLEYIKASNSEDKPLVEFDMDIAKLRLLVKNATRVNFVVFAHDGTRADTIMFVSFDYEKLNLDVINIPRDTYWRVEGYTEDYGNQKINAVYGRGHNLGGSEGVKQAVANLLQVPIHYFIKVNYEGAAAIVDSLGGIEVDVEFDMLYDDIYADPPLHIDLKAGRQLLDGENAVDYLRWRKNNDKIMQQGDLPRIDRMQVFAKTAIKKAVGTRLPAFIKACFNYVYTDIELDLLVSYGVKAMGIENQNIAFSRLPGDVKGYFYVSDPRRINHLLIDIYEQ